LRFVILSFLAANFSFWNSLVRLHARSVRDNIMPAL